MLIAYAEETIDTVLIRHAVQEPVQFSYQETRHMQLLDVPWKASGKMYMSPAFFIVEQKKPYRLVMASNRTSLWLYDGKNKKRRSRNISGYSREGSSLVALMMALRTGEIEILKARYTMILSAKEHQWALEMIPVESAMDKHDARIVLRGKADQAADELKIEYADGNHTLWEFTAEGHTKEEHTKEEPEDVSGQMKMLVQEARGG